MSVQSASLTKIWTSRSRAFLKEIFPYIRIMSMSGLPAVCSLFIIYFLISYFSFIHNIPAGFPIEALGIALLTLALCWSPLRTWLVQADIVFLMPKEHQMKLYMKRSYRRSLVQGILLLAVILLFYLPVYRQAAEPNSLWLIAVAAAAVKAGNSYFGWRERRVVYDGARILLRCLRWLLTAAAVAAWLIAAWWQALLFSLLLAGLLAALHRLPVRYSFAWERLIREEAATRKRYYLLFGMFTDIPALMTRPHRRSYLAWLLGKIKYGPQHAYIYLYAAAIIRLELSGIIMRLIALGSFVLYWAASAAAWSGYAASLISIFCLLLIGLQLGSLMQLHKESVWKHVYPLSEKDRVKQFITVDRFVLLISAVWLCVVQAVPLMLQGLYTPVIVSAVFSVLYMAWRPKRIEKKLTKLLQDY
ncbi:ABC transporter permease [Paenibacillus sp. GXUN7292]|uniref:ABC transporter permease n=1 Tax=Paenibacillus sp. GXUN7292 TaxID=3422499 RepID=UPI003D7D4273